MGVSMARMGEGGIMNKIGWCLMTWNPVWGCRNHCEYCYARGIAKRFGNVMAENEYYSRYWGNKIQ